MSNSENTQVPPPLFSKLNEHNYHTWKFDIQALLQRNGTWQIVNGTIPRPVLDLAGQDSWDTRNYNAAGVIYSQVEPSIQPLIREKLDNAPGMWTTLKDHFAKDNAASRFLIMDEFLSTAKQPEESLSAVVARVEEQLQQVKGSCPTDLTVPKLLEELAMMTLIRSLPDEFSNFKSALLLVPGSLDFKTVKEAFLQEERTRQPRASEQLAMRAFNSQPRAPRRRPGTRSNVVCGYPPCKKQGHTTEQCFMRQKDIARRSGEQQAKQKGKEKANLAEESSSDTEASRFAGNASTLDFTHPTSPLIADAGADWIADTGATSHMTPHRHWFSDYKPHKTAIRLADNTIIYSVGIGSVKFAPCEKR